MHYLTECISHVLSLREKCLTHGDDWQPFAFNMLFPLKLVFINIWTIWNESLLENAPDTKESALNFKFLDSLNELNILIR